MITDYQNDTSLINLPSSYYKVKLIFGSYNKMIITNDFIE